MNKTKYVMYHGRWQASTVIMSVPITIFSWRFHPVIALAFAQFIGACLFWYVDKWIFTSEK